MIGMTRWWTYCGEWSRGLQGESEGVHGPVTAISQGGGGYTGAGEQIDRIDHRGWWIRREGGRERESADA